MDNKAGIVTGGGSGIGKAAAILIAKEGGKVIVADFNEKCGNETVEEIRNNGGEAYFFQCDVTDELQVKSMVEFAVEKFGKLDWAYNNSGISGQENAPLHETHTDLFKKVVDVNLYGTYFCMKYEIAELLKNGGGNIVNACSVNCVRCTPCGSSYVASKLGAYGITQSSALDYAKSNIRINAIAPGTTRTPMIENLIPIMPDIIETTSASIPDGRLAEPEEQANTVLYLLSDLSSHMTGQMLVVDGGQTVNL